MQQSIKFIEISPVKLKLTRICILVLTSIHICTYTFSQPVKDSTALSLLNVFLDCDDCHFDYIRRNIGFVNYVRDRKQADLHILVTDQNTASNGEAFKINFIGLKDYQAINFTLLYNALTTATEFEIRQGMANKLIQGLMPFISETSYADQIKISVDSTIKDPASAQQLTEDPWNYWVFEVEMSGFIESEERQNNFYLETDFDANRITDEWRIRNSFEIEFEREAFKTNEGTVVKLNKEYEYDGSAVLSISNHLSVGCFGSVLSNTFTNMDLGIRFSPAIEWNLYPYDISDRKELTIAYSIGGRYNNYIDSTIYDRTSEMLMEHAVNARFNVDQPWGDISISIEGSNYFRDLRQHRIEFDSFISLRLIKGLSLEVGGSLNLIHDQLHLPKEDATTEDILLKRRELTTSYHYDAYVGISYTFGSIYNNIVNTRL